MTVTGPEGPAMIGLVTDSGAQLTPELRERYRVEIAPMGIVIDDVVHHEGIDLTTAEFYARLANGARVSTSAPSPGDLLAAYQRAVGAGATQIVSIHTGSSISATVGAATIAAGMAPVPVRVVDTGVASFLVSMCVWAAGERLAAATANDTEDDDRRDAEDDDSAGAVDRVMNGVAAAARDAAAASGSVFVVGVPERAVTGGRFVDVQAPITETSILELAPSGMRELAKATSVEAAMKAMAAHVAGIAPAARRRIAVGDAQRSRLGDQLARQVADRIGGGQVTRYDIGPSVGVHTGAGSIGVVWSGEA